jgi:hypothetical protein
LVETVRERQEKLQARARQRIHGFTHWTPFFTAFTHRPLAWYSYSRDRRLLQLLPLKFLLLLLLQKRVVLLLLR